MATRNLLLALVLALPAVAQAQRTQIDDPANLMGERVQPQDPADTLPINHGAAALQQLLLKLRTRASMMLIVAHPDDEDGGLLTYESRGQGARVAMLTLTRGEGGQNLMSADFDDALGLIRTQELLAADRYMGVDQFFGTEVDFGFSKTKEEAFKQWTHDRVLYDAVRAVRLYRPLVLASVFVGGPTDGHGHHQVSGEICQEVFTAAADPKVLPEMGLPPWAPLKVYARVPFFRVGPDGMFDYATGRTVPTRFHNYVTGAEISHEPTATVEIHEGDPAVVKGKPALGMDGLTYVQFARKGLALQKTQIGPNVRLAPAGKSNTGYTLMGSRLPCDAEKVECPVVSPASQRWGLEHSSTQPDADADLFAGIDTSLGSLTSLIDAAPAKTILPSLQSIDNSLAEAQRLFDPARPALTVPSLRAALETLDVLIEAVTLGKPAELPSDQQFNLLHELRVKRVQLNDAVVLAEGLTLQAETNAETLESAHGGEDLRVKFHNGSTETRQLLSLGTVGGGMQDVPTGVQMVRAGDSPVIEINTHLIAPRVATRPYFSRSNVEQPFYTLSDPVLRNAPATPFPIAVTAVVLDEGLRLELATVAVSPTQHSSTEPRQGAVLVPPVSVSLAPSAGIMTRQDKALHLVASVRSNESIRTLGGVKLFLKDGSGSEVEVLETATPGEHQKVVGVDEQVVISIPAEKIKQKSFTVQAAVTKGQEQFLESYRAVGYPGLPYTNYYTPATYKGVAVDVTMAPGLRVAYLPGTGDPVPDFLPNLGITPTIITTEDLTPAKLAAFDTIVLGVRAYAGHPELSGMGSQPLLDFARDGGVVIVQYNTSRYGDAEAPYPISTPGDSAHNVVEEAQPVHLLEPKARC